MKAGGVGQSRRGDQSAAGAAGLAIGVCLRDATAGSDRVGPRHTGYEYDSGRADTILHGGRAVLGELRDQHLDLNCAGAVEIKVLVAKLAQYGTATVKYCICPAGIVFVTGVSWTNAVGTGRCVAKTNANCQPSSTGCGLVAPARLSHTSSFHSPNDDVSVNRSKPGESSG